MTNKDDKRITSMELRAGSIKMGRITMHSDGRFSFDMSHLEELDPNTRAGLEAMQYVFSAYDTRTEETNLKQVVDSVKKGNSAVEINGVRIESCDTYGNTATTASRDRAWKQVELLREELDKAQKEVLEKEKSEDRYVSGVSQAKKTFFEAVDYVDSLGLMPQSSYEQLILAIIGIGYKEEL